MKWAPKSKPGRVSFSFHTKNPEGLLCASCSIMDDRGVATTYQKVYQERAGNNWRSDKELLSYLKMGECLMGFLVHCHKAGLEVLMCPWCNAVYDRKAAEAFERITYAQC